LDFYAIINSLINNIQMNKIVTLEPGYNLRDVKQHTVIGSTADLQNKTIKLLENSQEVLTVNGKRFNAVKIKVNAVTYLVA